MVGKGNDTEILSTARRLLKKNGSILGSAVAEVIRPRFPTFASAIPTNLDDDHPAIASIDGRKPISHRRVHDFVTEYFGPALHELGFGRGDRIALVLPNGPELALAILATGNWAASVPMSATGTSSELEQDMRRAGVTLVVGPYSGPVANQDVPVDTRFNVKNQSKVDWTMFGEVEKVAKHLGVPFVGLLPSPSEAGVFKFVLTKQRKPISFDDPVSLKNIRRGQEFDLKPNTVDDEALILFTSGTTGTKKLVPHLMGDMLTAATTIALSWALTKSDVNCNLMPLFHVGGIVRQVFSPIISGGCVICCPAFDPNTMWALLQKPRPFTWYYAAPTMHQLILETGRQTADGSSVSLEKKIRPKLRMIANAAGGLLPSLAVDLRKTFGANVLPSYGMTECMPISSPPANYKLQKPGTSGVAVGPELAIMNTTTMKELPRGETGPICVRGEPCFRGYGKVADDPKAEAPASLMEGGWFDTGDLGHMDKDGYLYITGRSKEVINRGGEIISPMEVEEAVAAHPDVAASAAFSAPHAVLQEVVGIVLVMAKGRRRLDLPALHEYLGSRLAPPKWPQCLVFMDGLPKSATNKLLRVQLGQRLGLPELTDEMTPVERTFEAECPPQGTELTVPIPCKPVAMSAKEVQAKLVKKMNATRNDRQLLVVAHPKKPGNLVCYVLGLDPLKVIEGAAAVLDRYSMPTHVVQLKRRAAENEELPVPGPIDAVATILQGKSNSKKKLSPHVPVVQEVFVQLLKLDYIPGPDANFFHLGGSSLLASQLASKMRKKFGVAFSGAEVFHHATVSEVAKLTEQRLDEATAAETSSDATGFDDSSLGARSLDIQKNHFDNEKLAPQASFFSSVFQLIPMFIILPFWQVSRYLMFFYLLLRSFSVAPVERDVFAFVAVLIVFHLLWVTITPLAFVLVKWVVIGRYRPGRYPIWSWYYLRWWFVDICRKLILRGIWGSSEPLLNFYYQMLGAKIGKGARISPDADIAEFDLITVGENAAIEYATVRAFGVDNGAMVLGPIVIGLNSSVGTRSVVAPNTVLHADSHLGPISSSYEIGNAVAPKNRRSNRRCIPEPNCFFIYCVGAPIEFLVNCIAQIPPILVLYWMLQVKGSLGKDFETVDDLMGWLCDPHRVLFYLGIRVARSVLSPFFYMAAAIVVKKFFIGKFKAGPRDEHSQWQLLRHWLSATLFSRKKIQDVTDLIGRHYELVSVLYRMLGAKVGKRVFWPGHQPVFSGEFDLLEVGDDVVFGSRSSIFFSTPDSCKKVTLSAGSNVADNCVVLPGAILGKNAVLGSNSICPEDWYLPAGSVWFGSKGCEPTCLEKGADKIKGGLMEQGAVDRDSMPLVGDESTLRPFGRAFYNRDAPYFVWPLSLIVAFTFIVKSFIAAFHALPLLASIHGAAAILYGVPLKYRYYEEHHYTFWNIYVWVCIVFLGINVVRIVLWLLIELAAKWAIMGRREVGRYNYDASSYGQRWELYQTIAKIRKFGRLNFLDFMSGTPFMVAYVRLNGGRIGKDCCLYPAGADPFMPEPDLVVMGDRCVVDNASLVCHLNTRGNFELAQITIENDCTLRTRSRLQQGCYMEEGSQLLEKSIAMTGEVLDAHSVWQGIAATMWFQYESQQTSVHSGDDSNTESTSLLQSKWVGGRYV